MWIVYGFAGLVSLVLVIFLVGSLLPKGHSATRRATYRRPAADVWAAITGIDGFASWRSDLKSVERLPDQDGKPVWREKGRNGTMTLVQVEAVAPSRFVGRIADKNLPFSGTWTYELRESEGGTLLSITEDGEIYNPAFRCLARYVFGYHATMERYLVDLGRKFGEETKPVA